MEAGENGVVLPGVTPVAEKRQQDYVTALLQQMMGLNALVETVYCKRGVKTAIQGFAVSPKMQFHNH